MTPPPPPTKPISTTRLYTTNNPSPSDIDTLLTHLSTTYLTHPLTTSFITELDSLPPPYPSSLLTPERLKQYFETGITEVVKSNVLITFAYPSSPPPPPPPPADKPLVSALFEPPSFTSHPPTSVDTHRPPGPVLQTYRSLSAALKSKWLSIPATGLQAYLQPAAPSQAAAAPTEDPYPGEFNKDVSLTGGEVRPFYHLAFMAGGGDGGDAMAEVVAEYQGRAGAEGVPIWCVVGTEGEREVFERLGFRVVEEGRVGVGVVREDGWPAGTQEGDARGVRVWAMIWEAAVEAV